MSYPSWSPTRRKWLSGLLGLSSISACGGVARGSYPSDAEAAKEETSREVTKWIVWLADNYLPRHYDNDKNWGTQKKVIDGLEWRQEGLKLETKRRWKEVNHGNWTKYHLEIREPKENFQIDIRDVTTLQDGRVEFQAHIKAPLDIQGRLSVWQYDVQVISLNADAEADVEVNLGCRVAIKLHPLTFPPDVLLQPEVLTSDMQLTYFRLNRLSQIGGPMAKRLGEGMEFFLRDKVRNEGTALTAKLNRAIDKRRDRLRISGSDWLQGKMQELFKSPTTV